MTLDADGWNERYLAADLVWGSEPNRFVRQLCERLAVGTALDVGCGEGRNALWLARLGWQVVGADFSSAAIERAREMTAEEPETVRLRTAWRVADVIAEPPRPDAYDLTIVSYLHMDPDDIALMLRAAALSVRPRGHLVVVGHDRRNLAEGVGGPQDADRLYAPEQLAAAAADGGLEVELAETVERPTFDGVALDAILRARRPPLP